METAWQHLGRLVDDERVRQGLSWSGVARRTGMGKRTLTDIHRARRTNFNSDTKAKLEHFMGWQHGSFDLVVKGRNPRRIADPALAEVINAWPRFPDEVRNALGVLAAQYRS